MTAKMSKDNLLNFLQQVDTDDLRTDAKEKYYALLEAIDDGADVMQIKLARAKDMIQKCIDRDDVIPQNTTWIVIEKEPDTTQLIAQCYVPIFDDKGELVHMPNYSPVDRTIINKDYCCMFVGHRIYFGFECTEKVNDRYKFKEGSTL